MDKTKIFLISIIVLLIITNIFTFVYLNSKLNFYLENQDHINTTSILESSTESFKLYSFSKYQYEHEFIDKSTYINSIEELILLHNKLISLSNEEVKTKKFIKVREKMTELLNLRKEGFENLKSSIELDTTNFETIANSKFEEATIIANLIEDALINHKK